MHRGWQDAEVFAGAEYSERDAWVWLIEAACWQPKTVRIKGEKVTLQRGQMTFAQRFMADNWGWSKSRVDRFLKRLEAAEMVILGQKQRGNSGATTGATAGHPAGQGSAILTICNYDVYQGEDNAHRGNARNEIGATPFQNRTEDKEERKKERRDDDVSAGASERASENEAMPDVLAIADEAARAAGVRHVSPQDIIRNTTLIREWQEAGADPPAILATIRDDRARPDAPLITSLKFFDIAIRKQVAQREANEHGHRPENRQPRRGAAPPSGRLGVVLELLAESRAAAAPADQPGNHGTAGRIGHAVSQG